MSIENPENLKFADNTQTTDDDSSSSTPEPTDSVSLTSGPADNGHTRGLYDFIQLHFVKSPLTVNPCLVCFVISTM